MSSTFKQRIRPVTAITRLKRKPSSASSTSGARGRRATSAKARAEPPRVDLNPPQWLPLLCDLKNDIPERKLAFKRRTSTELTTLDDLHSLRHGQFDDDELCAFENKEKDEDEDDKEDEEVEDLPEVTLANQDNQNNDINEGNIPKRKNKTQDELKRFLSAAMDSVRFFLVTSSIGQAHNKEKEKIEEEEEEDEEDTTDNEPVVAISRCELIINNAALTEKPWRFSIETYKNDPAMLEYYTGFKNYDLINAMFQLLKPSQENISKWKAEETGGRYRDGAFRFGIVTLFDEFFMFLYKLRHNPSPEDLSLRFCMPESTAICMMDDWLNYLYVCFGRNPIWATRDNIDIYMPSCFKSISPCVRAVLHIVNLKISVPFEYETIIKHSHCDETLENSAVQITDVEKDLENDPPNDQAQTTAKNSDKKNTKYSETILDNELKNEQVHSTSKSSDNKKSQTKKRSSKMKKSSSKYLCDASNDSIATKKMYNKDSIFDGTEKQDQIKQVHLHQESIPEEEEEEGKKSFKCLVVFQPSGAAALVGDLKPLKASPEELLTQSGILKLLDECDDLITIDDEDVFHQGSIEEVLHPYAVNYMNFKFLCGSLSHEELKKESPLKAHRLDCMRWHIFQSVKWVENMKIWDGFAELPSNWMRDINRVWKIACLLTNFLPADPCLEFGV